ncbi:HAD family hydrolase [Amycolatopsis sp.]|uniref:HAD family hydrolase n=1 Tax=Amycolatopsis sp. TaxID=37632 RepID=UPI002B57E7F6|nr:HAD family hydrolase [Amycolatopsis sp.]HVV12678.1 HAD family hydrolase [Amycolatopsis sp.]
MSGSGVAWLFDVDGTVLDLVTGSSLRPLAKELFFALRARGVPVLLWSAGGADYAVRRTRVLGIAGLVTATYSKTRRDEHGRWLLPELPAAHRPAVLVDDEPREIRYTGEIIGVPAYVGHNPRDTAFASLLRRLAA